MKKLSLLLLVLTALFFFTSCSSHKHELTHHDSVEATCEQAGTKEYWSCEKCGKVFADSEGKNETTLESLTIQKKEHDYDLTQMSYKKENDTWYKTCPCKNIINGETHYQKEEVSVDEVLANAKVYFHYKRTKDDYTDWNIWVWQQNGVRYAVAGQDDFGVYYTVDLADASLDSYHASTLGYIFHRGNWAEKDIDKDRFVSLTPTLLDNNGEIHVYSKQGDTNIYLDSNLKNMLCLILTFTLNSSLKTAEVQCNCQAQTYQLLENGKQISSGKASDVKFDISLPSSLDFINNSYSVSVKFNEEFTLEKELNINSYFDSAKFAEENTYTGDDLGVTVEDGKTKFVLWAPVSQAVSVQLFNYGHPTSYGTQAYPGDDTPAKEYPLAKGENGTWNVTVNEDLSGYYYTYTVQNGTKSTKDIVDPYAKAAGLNGLRGYIVDFSKTNPTNWSYEYTRPYKLQELIVYELHVRDLTMDSTWNGTEANRGKYLGMVESGTTYTKGETTVTTGFDHIKELGVNTVQILPFFDQSNDERKDEFNWGYNPQNYNVLEGLYSSNPYDAETRIKEFKQMMQVYRENNIEIVMDVVYNHMNGISSSSFDMIVPGYYFRYNADGTASNGSGCGNETASERSMVRKFMVDSVKFWVQEYNISGFRFDLMGLHDIETMNLIAEELHKIDPNIVVWGEPWTGGTSTLPSSKQSVTSNGNSLKGVSYFNDNIRDKIKGSVFDQTEGYWLQGEVDDIGFAAALRGTGMDMATQKWTPGRLLNYVSCHDNNTLRDKLVLTGVSEEDLADADVVAQTLCILSEQVPFILSGEEFLRSKPYENPDTGEIELSHNSYNLPDSTNSMKWNEKIDNLDTFNKYKALININRTHNIFHLDTYELANASTEVFQKTNGAVGYKVTNQGLEDTWNEVIIFVTNASVTEFKYTLEGNYKVAFASGNNYQAEAEITGEFTLGNYEVLVVYK